MSNEVRGQMVVSVMVRDGEGWPLGVKTVQIADVCPRCGGPRGEVTSWIYPEDGHYYTPDVWENPCGHVDRYSDVLKEAANE